MFEAYVISNTKFDFFCLYVTTLEATCTMKDGLIFDTRDMFTSLKFF